MSDLSVIRKWKAQENKFDDYKLLEEVKFDDSHNDLCSYVWYRYFQYNVFKGRLNNSVQETFNWFQKHEGKKSSNFVRNYVLDGIWVSSLFNEYYKICDGDLELDLSTPVSLQSLIAYSNDICQQCKSLDTTSVPMSKVLVKTKKCNNCNHKWEI